VDHVDDAAGGHEAVVKRGGALEDLHALNVLEGEVGEIDDGQGNR